MLFDRALNPLNGFVPYEILLPYTRFWDADRIIRFYVFQAVNEIGLVRSSEQDRYLNAIQPVIHHVLERWHDANPTHPWAALQCANCDVSDEGIAVQAITHMMNLSHVGRSDFEIPTQLLYNGRDCAYTMNLVQYNQLSHERYRLYRASVDRFTDDERTLFGLVPTGFNIYINALFISRPTPPVNAILVQLNPENEVVNFARQCAQGQLAFQHALVLLEDARMYSDEESDYHIHIREEFPGGLVDFTVAQCDHTDSIAFLSENGSSGRIVFQYKEGFAPDDLFDPPKFSVRG